MRIFISSCFIFDFRVREVHKRFDLGLRTKKFHPIIRLSTTSDNIEASDSTVTICGV